MSVQAMALVKSHVFGLHTKKLVLMVLADYCDDDLATFAGQERVAREAEIGLRTVQRVLAALEQDGLIRRIRRGSRAGGRTSDRIELIASAIEQLPRSTPLPATLATNRKPATDDRKPAIRDEVTRQSLAGEPLVEPSVEPPVLLTEPSGNGDRFDAFWAAYPKNNGSKQAARKAWAKAIRKAKPEQIIRGAEAFAKWAYLPDVMFRPHASTWLNGQRWCDDLPGGSRGEPPAESMYRQNAGSRVRSNVNLATGLPWGME